MTDDLSGTPLDPDESVALIPTWIQTQADLNEIETANIIECLDWLARTKRNVDDVLSVGWLLALHRRMFGNVWAWAGTTRSTGKNIGVDVWEIRPRLVALVDDASLWFCDDDTLLSDLARFHHALVWIHAFPMATVVTHASPPIV